MTSQSVRPHPGRDRAEHYESHVTVSGMEAEEFADICKKIGVKPILIEMDSGAGYLPQMMTGKFHRCNRRQAQAEMEDIASHFSNVVRKKLEFIVGKRTALPEHLYLEFHAKFEMAVEQLQGFVDTVHALGGHTSQNVLKTAEHNKVFHFVTTRDKEHMRSLVAALAEYKLMNTIMECVVFDDNPKIDVNWFGCHGCLVKAVDLDATLV